jgi:uncharacterized protein YktB (UPF0637 family)
MQTQNPKVTAALTVLRTRGYKELNELQIKVVHDLALIEEISAIDIANEVEGSPAERTARTVKAVRSKTSKVFQALSDIAKPKEEEV